jgi:putative transposase
MSDLIWLSEAQMRRIEPYFPLAHGVPRVDDRRIISGIIFIIRNGLHWRDAPAEYGPPETIYNPFIRWSRMGVFNKIFEALAAKGGKPDQLMIDATRPATTFGSFAGSSGTTTSRRGQGLEAALRSRSRISRGCDSRSSTIGSRRPRGRRPSTWLPSPLMQPSLRDVAKKLAGLADLSRANPEPIRGFDLLHRLAQLVPACEEASVRARLCTSAEDVCRIYTESSIASTGV